MPTRSPALALGLCLLAACSAGTTPPPGPSKLPAEGDALIVQAVLDGKLAAADGLVQVAQSAGWPVKTSQGYLFAFLDGGMGPYVIRSPNGRFADAVLRSEAGLAWALLPVPEPVDAEYVFRTRFNDAQPDDWGRRIVYDGYGEHHRIETLAGHVERWPGVGDAVIAPRTVRVWVPDAGPAPTHHLYAHDGQNLFNPAAPWGGWRLDLYAGPTTLVIGIDNSPARIAEYTHVQDLVGGSLQGGLGDAYTDYLEGTVRPFIEARYGTPARVGVIGSSLGGLITLHQQWRHPGRYDFIASLSGTVGWGSIGAGVHNPTVIERYASLAACPAVTLYLDSGGGPGASPNVCVDADGDGVMDDDAAASDNYCENAQLRDVLIGLGCGAGLHYVWAQGASHDEAAWKARAPGIMTLFNGL